MVASAYFREKRNGTFPCIPSVFFFKFYDPNSVIHILITFYKRNNIITITARYIVLSYGATLKGGSPLQFIAPTFVARNFSLTLVSVFKTVTHTRQHLFPCFQLLFSSYSSYLLFFLHSIECSQPRILGYM